MDNMKNAFNTSTHFASLKTLSNETKLKEFKFKFMHRIIVMKRERFRYFIQSDDNCIYCAKKDSIDHSLCLCEKKNSTEAVSWFSGTNRTIFSPSNDRRETVCDR